MIAETYLQSSIDKLGDYLSYGSTKHKNRVADRSERVGWEAGRNLGLDPTMAEAKAGMKSAASRSTVEKPIYHLVVSWQSGNEKKNVPPDNPSREEMEWTVDQIREELGLEDHYAWMVGHIDTDTPHVHVAIGRVHPQKGETWQPSYDEIKIYHTLREIEEEKGWHRPAPMTIEEKWEEESAESPAYWEETHEKWGRERSVRLWAREEGIADQMREARCWRDVEEALEGTGAELESRREQGMVLKWNEGYAALSSIHSEISRPKLEERFGRTWDEHQRRVPLPESVPAADRPAADRPADETPAKDAPAEDAPEEGTLAEEAHGQETPAEDISGEDIFEEDISRENISEEDPAGKTPAEVDLPRGDRRQIPFEQEVRIRAAPVLLETERREELQSLPALRRRLAPHGLQVEYNHVEGARSGGSQETLVVLDGERRAPLSAVLPRRVARLISGRSSRQGRRQERPRRQADWESAGLLEKPRVKEMKLKRKLIPTGRVGSGGSGGLLLEDASGAARALFQAKPEARGRLLRSAVREAGQSTSDSFLERRLEKLEEEAREEARRRVSLNGRQRALLELTSCLDVRADWTRPSEELLSEELLDEELLPAELLDERISSEERPAEEPATEEQPGGERSGGGGLSPVERYRRLPPGEQEAVEERMESIVRKELLNQVRQAREEEELGPDRDQIERDLEEGRLEEGWWRRAAHIYLSRSERGRRDLRQMLSEEMTHRLEDAADRMHEERREARQAYNRLSPEGQEAFEKARGHLEEIADMSREDELREEELREALAQVKKAWTEVGQELSEADQQALLHQGSTLAMADEAAENILREARRLREGGRQDRGQSRDHGRDRGPERGGRR